MTRHFIVSVLSTIAVQIAALPAMAQDIPAPKGEVILTITGNIAVTNVGSTLQFDRETFASLADSQFDTSTNWTDGVRSFQGVSLHTLTELLGVTDGTLIATAINDYAVEIPVTDAKPNGPIIAQTMNGSEMSIREKGPLWIVYPYDSSPEYRTAVIFSRSIWQLDMIDVLP